MKKPSSKARAAIIKRAHRAWGDLELSVTTKADKARVWVIWEALRALDDEQADLKYKIEDLLDEFDKQWQPASSLVTSCEICGCGPNKPLENLLAGLKEIVKKEK